MFTSILLRVNKFFAMNSFVKNRTITLPENTSITPEMVEKLDDLLSTSQPNGIRKNILKIYMQYLINEHDTLPNDFQDIAYDFYIKYNKIQGTGNMKYKSGGSHIAGCPKWCKFFVGTSVITLSFIDRS